MSWIKIRTNLATDPAVAAIGILTKMHPRQVVGCLVAVWCWADPLTADGFIAHATSRLIDDVSGKRGFADAMVSVDWLCVESGGVRFPKWDRHHSQSAKARAGEAERKRLSRQLPEKSARDVSKMSGQTSGQNTEESPDQRRGEEIREENTNTPLSPTAAADAADSVPAAPKSNEYKPDAFKVAEIYGLYPLKVGRPKAIASIANALKRLAVQKDLPVGAFGISPEEYLRERTKLFSEAVACWPVGEDRFVPHPTTWFNQARYEDDSSTWVRRNDQSQRPEKGRASFA